MCAKNKLADCIGIENTDQLTDMIVRVQERAITRHSQQAVEIVFNEKGFVRHINGSDNVNGVKPKVYTPE